MTQIDKILDQVKDFPTLPTIFTKVLEMLSNPNTTVQDLAELISKDIAIAGKVLQVVNSPIYGLISRVATISQAIFYIGFNEVRNICLAVSVIEVFKSVGGGSKFNIVELWKHSIATGVISRYIAQKVGIKNLDNYFISGIMHDIGKLFFVKYFNKRYMELIEEANESFVPLESLEKKVFGVNHLVLGEMIAKKWNLPSSISIPIRYHHSGASEKFDPLLACVHLANTMSHALFLGNSGNPMISKPNPEIWANLKFTDNFFMDERESIVSSYYQSINILKLDK